MGAGILFVGKHANKLYFLLALEVCDKKWSDFGGKANNNETRYQTAIREGYEETNGFFGNKREFKKLVDSNNILKIDKYNNSYTTYLINISYDKNLPFYFNNNVKFINDNFKELVDKNGFFEKKMVKWFSINDLKNNRNYRIFYKEIIDILIDNYELIKKKLISYLYF